MHRVIVSVWLAAAVAAALAQVPDAELAKPPAGARHFVRIGDLRQTRVVMLDGKLLDADALRRAAGFSGRPK